MNILLRWLLLSVGILVTAYLLPGVYVSGFTAALVTALTLGIINAFIKPFIVILTLPINILTLGLFSLVINAFLVLLAGAIVVGFVVTGFWVAFFFAIVLTLVMYLASHIFN